jgi:flavorubredoxin
MLYTAKILRVLEQVQESGLAINVICPDHGIIWRKEPEKIIAAYEKWSHQAGENKAVVIYDTMWHSTQKMAEAIAAGIAAEGVSAKPIHIRSSHRSDIMTEVLDARAVVVGSPTLNNNIFPTVSDILTYMKGLKPKNKIGAAFGSYGWSGESIKLIRTELEAMKFDMMEPDLRIQYVPDDDGIQSCLDFGREIGRAVKKALA